MQFSETVMTASGEGRAAKIALMTGDFLPMAGGIAQGLDGLLRSTAVIFHWHVYTTARREMCDDAALPYAITRLDAWSPRERRGDRLLLLRKVNSLFGHLRAPRRARTTIEEMRGAFHPDIVLLGCWDHASSYWAAACRREGLPHVILAHGVEIVGRRGPVMGRRRAHDFRNAGAVIANSDATGSAVRALGVDPRRVVVINPGVCAPMSPPLSPGELFATLRGIGVGEAPYVLCVGRLIRRKGFDLVISAFCTLGGDFPQVHLVIAGDGPERPRLARMASESTCPERIHFPGHVDEGQKAALFQGCQFFVTANREVPGELEGFGLVFREAAQFGKASIGGRNGGVCEAVIDGATGILVDTSRDNQALAGAMRSLLASPERARELGRRGHALVEERGTWEHAGTQYRSAFERVLEDRAGRRTDSIARVHP